MSSNERTAILVLKASFENHDVTMKRYADGAVTLSSDGADNFIYLYPHQVSVLSAMLGADIKIGDSAALSREARDE